MPLSTHYFFGVLPAGLTGTRIDAPPVLRIAALGGFASGLAGGFARVLAAGAAAGELPARVDLAAGAGESRLPPALAPA